jgi:hypothetical protein
MDSNYHTFFATLQLSGDAFSDHSKNFYSQVSRFFFSIERKKLIIGSGLKGEFPEV